MLLFLPGRYACVLSEPSCLTGWKEISLSQRYVAQWMYTGAWVNSVAVEKHKYLMGI